MIRAKWLTAEPKISLRALAGRMRSHEFTNDSQDGFLLDRTRDDHIEGRYIEKLTYQETIPDPFGQELTFERVTYRQVQFILYREFPQLELRDVPRGTLAFMSKLLQLCDFDLTSTSFSVDVMRWVDSIARTIGSAVTMDMMQLSEITIGPNVTGTMVLKSDRDVRDSLKSVIGSRPYTVEKVRLKWNDSTHAITIHLSNTGSAKVDSIDADLLADLRKALPRPTKS
jgi:hypothetical protein